MTRTDVAFAGQVGHVLFRETLETKASLFARVPII